MKRSICILLVLAMLAGFAGCTKSAYYTAGKLSTIGTYTGHTVTLEKKAVDDMVRRQYGGSIKSDDLDWIKVIFERIDGEDNGTADVSTGDAADATAAATADEATADAATADVADNTAEDNATADVTATEDAEPDTEDEESTPVPADTLTAEQRTVTMDDVIIMDFVGYVNGEKFDGGTSRDYQYVMGSYSFIEGFDTGMNGKQLGEKFSLNLRFPDDYRSADLAGKDVVFDVVISARALAPTTDEGVEKYFASSGVTTVNELRKKIEESMYLSDVLDKILDTYTLSDKGEEFVQDYIENYRKRIQEVYDNYSTQENAMIQSFDDACRFYTYYYVLGTSYDWNAFQQYIRTSWKSNFVLFDIAEKEGLVATDDDIKDYAKSQIESDTQGTLQSSYNITNAKEYVNYFGADYVQFIATLDNSSNRIYEIIQNGNSYTVE